MGARPGYILVLLFAICHTITGWFIIANMSQQPNLHMSHWFIVIPHINQQHVKFNVVIDTSMSLRAGNMLVMQKLL